MKKKCLLISILVSLVLFISGITYSLFDSSASANSDLELASFLVDAKKTNYIDLPIDNINPGEDIEFDFQVENNSDVKVVYNITIKTMHFMPLNITLLDDNLQEIIVCDENRERNLHNELECTSKDLELGFMNNDIHNYKLHVDFPKEYNTLEYSSLVDYINLEINSYQKLD